MMTLYLIVLNRIFLQAINAIIVFDSRNGVKFSWFHMTNGWMYKQHWCIWHRFMHMDWLSVICDAGGLSTILSLNFLTSFEAISTICIRLTILDYRRIYECWEEIIVILLPLELSPCFVQNNRSSYALAMANNKMRAQAKSKTHKHLDNNKNFSFNRKHTQLHKNR